MSRNTLIPAVATAAICGAVLLWQAGRNRGLAKQVEAERERVAGLEQQAASPGAVPGAVSALNPIAPLPGSVDAAVAEARANSTPEERIARAVSQIGLLVADIGDLDRSPAALFKVLPDLLRIVQDLDLDEMIAVAEKLDAPLSMRGPTDGKGATKMILMMLAAEQNPSHVLKNPEIANSQELRGMVLGALARKDPEAARAWIAESDLNEGEKKQFEQMMIMQTLRNDFESGIAMIREGGQEAQQILSMMQMMPMPKSKLPAVFAAMEDPDNVALRPMLAGIAIGAAVTDGGIAGAKAMVEERGMSNDEVASFLDNGIYRLIEADPVESLAWLTEVQSEEQQQQSIPNAIQMWARKDYNAAGEWLGQMQASPVKDDAIGNYSNMVTRVDPKAATIWAAQIGDEQKRQSALESAGRQWQAKEPAAAAAWLKENGIELEVIVQPDAPESSDAPE